MTKRTTSLVTGIAIILVAEAWLLIDVVLRHGVIVPSAALDAPDGVVQAIARQVAVNMTPICWVGYLFVADGILARGGGSPVRLRPRRFILCVIASIPIWVFFDWINFTFLDAWRYHGLPANIVHRYAGYVVAFGAVCPGMFMAANLFLRLGLRRVRWPALPLGPLMLVMAGIVGLVFVGVAFVVRDPIANLTLWLGPFLLLDPLNLRLGAPSILGDWRAGRYGRTIALLAGGLLCGLLWEFWNYWAAAKWTYHLPFLGPLESVRYFEMPVAGLLGFLPFGVACWVMFQSVIALMARIRIRVEPIADDETL